MKFFTHTAVCAVLLIGAASCSTVKDIAYFQDFPIEMDVDAQASQGMLIQPDDLLSIIITTKDPELGEIFNLQPGTSVGSSGHTTNAGYSGSNNNGNRLTPAGYMVDPQGDIVFPQLGELHVAGLTRRQVESMIKQRILKEDLLKDFSVQVSFLNPRITIIGDVASPGNKPFPSDKYTLIQALMDAGDLNITAERTIYVIREKDGKRHMYPVDLKSKELFNSPVYYMQQNDIVYVLPNNIKAGQRDLNSNSFRQWGTYLGLFSSAIGITTMVIALTK